MPLSRGAACEMLPAKAMTDFKFSCPTCGQHLQGDVRYVGTEVTCPNCKGAFVVPNPKVTTSLRVEGDRWIPPPAHAHGAPATVSLPAPAAPRLVPPPPRTNGLAIASLALSVASVLVGPLGFVPGIICGHLARARIAKTAGLGGRDLALAGLIIGYVFLGLTVVGLAVFLLFVAKFHAGMGSR